MSDYVFESYYRSILSDLTIDREESNELKSKFEEANPPPDKLVWLRAAAFRIGCEFLTDDRDKNVSLLRSINAIVYALEITCMVPKDTEGDSNFDEAKVEELYREKFSDLTIDKEEGLELVEFFKEHTPPKSKLGWTRACAFRIGSELLSDDKNKNISLLRCINYVIHALETNCLTPKPYVLKVEPPLNASLEEAVQHLWDLDVNRLTPDRDYVINVQKGKKPFWQGDSAADPLFTRVDTTVFRRPTYKTFIALLDNYEAQTGQAEKVTSTEKRENWAFLRAIMQTGPMQFCHKYCCAKKSDVPSDQEGFMKLLYRIWFDLYFRERGGRPDSSGFEHVFVGEIKNGAVSGFHNWIMFYLEEKKGTVDYRGYIKPRSRNSAVTDSNDHVLTLQFTWNGIEKSVGTSFIGVSPEFEMALYTMCFLVGQQENEVQLNTETDIFGLNIKVFTMARDKIGTSFVEALEHSD